MQLKIYFVFVRVLLIALTPMLIGSVVVVILNGELFCEDQFFYIIVDNALLIFSSAMLLYVSCETVI